MTLLGLEDQEKARLLRGPQGLLVRGKAAIPVYQVFTDRGVSLQGGGPGPGT